MSAPGAAEGTLAGRAASAAQWQAASSVTKGVLQFGVTMLLARLLTPTDFGLVALAMIIVGFAEMVVDLGIGPALVQREELNARHVRVSFTVSALIGGGAALLLIAAAPLFALLLRDPAVTPVLRWEALIFLFAGLGATARALLERRLDFRSRFLVDAAGYLGGYALLAITLALMGYGVWSLVAGAVAQAAISALLVLAVVRHPLRPLLAGPELRGLMDFGAGVMLNRIVVYTSYNGDNLVVGRWLGPAALGLYSRAFQLMMFPLHHLQSVTWNVLFAAYSRLQGDRPRAARAYLKGIQLNALVVAPVMAGMIAAGPHLIVGLYGPQWVAATSAVQILCAVGLLRAVYGATGALAHAFGKVYAEFRRQAVFAVLVVAAGLAGTRWGITGVAAGVAAAVTVQYLAMAQLGVRLTGIRWSDFFDAQLPGAAVAAGVAAACRVVRLVLEGQGVGSAGILLAVIATAAAAVPAALYLLPGRLRPESLFRSMQSTVERMPAALRHPIRRIMRVPPEPMQATS